MLGAPLSSPSKLERYLRSACLAILRGGLHTTGTLAHKQSARRFSAQELH